MKRRVSGKYFGNAYRGGPGVPHSGSDRFVNIWVGSTVFAVLTSIWHDKAMLYEQYHWKRARKKNQPYEFLWNKTWDKTHREHYYYNWPIYFP
ncbi:hypothetical protein CR513_38864, partial [Mucuna pruriens]